MNFIYRLIRLKPWKVILESKIDPGLQKDDYFIDENLEESKEYIVRGRTLRRSSSLTQFPSELVEKYCFIDICIEEI